MTAPRLGVCYYPEHWPEATWKADAEKMAALGLSQIRIGEFAWGRIEPSQGEFEWDWLDRAIDTLGAAGLEVMLGTPTATPPKWLIDQYPDVLGYDEEGRPRRFGSRRHYCFSSARYRKESVRIVKQVAARYGGHDAVTAWQTDNEYGCHNTARSYSPEAARCFRIWLEERYKTPAALNEAWGTVFWSQDYRSFDEVDLPNLTVTEPNPAHVMDFFRFSSDQVISFNRIQTDIIRKYAPGRMILHNFMGFFTDFDHFAISNDLDAVGWDSYPLGFLDMAPFPEDVKKRFMRQGHPDFTAFHHDLYRACGQGRWQVSEQQPGPVNWAHHNPAPLAGMVRLWSHEAFAHGGEVVSYFRWRQAPFAQEQMHAGLERPDGSATPAFGEVRQVRDELDETEVKNDTRKARVALIFSYEAGWAFEAQPQGESWRYFEIVLTWYSVLRRFGLNIDIVSPKADFDDYDLVVAPSLPMIDDGTIKQIKASSALFLFGPRSGSKIASLSIPPNLAPGPLQSLISLKVTHSESFPAFHREQGRFSGVDVTVCTWLDHVKTDLAPLAKSDNGAGLLYRQDRILYLTALPDAEFLAMLLTALLGEANIDIQLMPEDIRLRRNGALVYAFNYGHEVTALPQGAGPRDGGFILGGDPLPPAGVAIWCDQPKNG